ncbi:D-alanyl-D-alanine carboxypeptidase family protein [Fontibacillus sp. BL9]|uniref:M15 family metallopeptidase n=1 Tax=Fontibacillus sp. BL9 TaxID=3389971 RepID=UPI003977F2C9
MRHRSGWGAVWTALVLMLTAVLFTGCASDTAGPQTANQTPDTEANDTGNAGSDNGANAGNTPVTNDDADSGTANDPGNGTSNVKDGDGDKTGNGTDAGPKGNGSSPDDQSNEGNSGDGSQAAAADADSVAVLVNKEFALPEDHKPDDLVYPDVRFTFKEKIEKRMMRSEAASALEKMFAGAEKDGIYLAGVSAYRSHSTQTSLFNRYVKKDGLEKAKTYSAVPGHSEHETGLAIDVSGSDGKCAAEDCFGDTEEAKWLAKHAPEYGFIIRYPDGKEDITGYKYEPWHLRYVGTDIAADIADRDITLEEYYDAVPVSANP